jgi:hypothetical protein
VPSESINDLQYKIGRRDAKATRPSWQYNKYSSSEFFIYKIYFGFSTQDESAALCSSVEAQGFICSSFSDAASYTVHTMLSDMRTNGKWTENVCNDADMHFLGGKIMTYVPPVLKFKISVSLPCNVRTFTFRVILKTNSDYYPKHH